MKTPSICLLIGSSIAVTALAQEAGEYRRPPEDIVAILKAPPLPGVSINPARTHMLLIERQAMPTIADLAQPMLRLAGDRINPNTNGRHGSSGLIGLRVMEIQSGEEKRIALPQDANARLEFPSWSPDGSKFAFTITFDDGSEIWLGYAASGGVKQLTERSINTLVSGGFNWMPDGNHLIIFFIDTNRGEPPVAANVPTGPVMQETTGRTAPVRTYQDLLSNPHDEKLFDYYFSAQPVMLNIETGAREDIAGVAVYGGIDPSPTGRYLMVSRVLRPYSYMVPAGMFPEAIDIIDRETGTARELVRLPLRDETPIGGVPTSPRSHQWQDTEGVDRILWVEALDGGDPRNKEAPHRDSIMAVDAARLEVPFELWRTPQRFAGIQWMEDETRAFVSDYDRDRRWSRTWMMDLRFPATIIDPSSPSLSGRGQGAGSGNEVAESSSTPQPPPSEEGGASAPPSILPQNDPVLIWDRSAQDRYGDPGRPVTTTNAAGRSVIDVEGGDWIYLDGQGASPEGDRPFLDRFNLMTRETERLWRNEGESYESFIAMLTPAPSEGGGQGVGAAHRNDAPTTPLPASPLRGGRGQSILLTHETPVDPPNYFITDLDDGSRTQITHFEHPAPQLKDVKKEIVTYQREDGVTLSATLYLPPGYDPQSDGPLPLVVWAYPLEYNDAYTAGQVRGSPWRFTSISGPSHLFFLLQGYAILDNATMPVVGDDPLTVNDTFLEQVVASAQAAIDFASARGVGDPNRVGVGGHSYGAFMTANLLAHSDLFSAGIARSGAYNRTLTPFGFQSEERTLWEAPDVYANLSPFMHADTINEPLLMIHGEMDNNTGTFPIQSERLYHAIQGHGGTARLVLLPFESHGYRAEESVMHTLAEMLDWFNRYVKESAE